MGLQSHSPSDPILTSIGLQNLRSGASLESLAKGAVQFSRRFTVQELQNRWLALLYDPVISAEASARMIEFERSAVSLPSKPYRCEDSKESNRVSGKRKAESVRSYYYSMRKSICNEPFDSTDLNYLVGPGHNDCSGNGNELSAASCMLVDPISNHFGLRNLNVDITHNSVPEFRTEGISAANAGVTADACYTGFHSSVKEDLQMTQNNMHARIPCTFGENVPLAISCSVVEESGQPKGVRVPNMSEAHHLDSKPSVIHDQSIGNMGKVCSGFGGSQVFDSPISDCGGLLHNLGCTSPLPPMPIWSTIEGISAPTIPDVHLSGSEQDIADTFAFPERELSDALLNFTNDEELFFMGTGEKDGIDKSFIDGFGSILLDSPNGNMPNIAATEAATAPHSYHATSGGEHCGVSDDKRQCHYSDAPDGHAVCSSESRMAIFVSSMNPQFPELRNGVICCLLNTEDTEIPSNDDVFLPYRMPSPPLSLPKPDEERMEDSWTVSFLFPYERITVSSRERNASHLLGGREVKIEVPNSDPHSAFRIASTDCQDAVKTSANGSTSNPLPAIMEGGVTDIERANHLNYNTNSYLVKPVSGFDNLMSYAQVNAISCKHEVNALAQNQRGHTELSSVKMTVPDLVINHSPADQEEVPSDIDDDVPHFSDVEAMILDMDLSPDDQDFYARRERLQTESEPPVLENGMLSRGGKVLDTSAYRSVLGGIIPLVCLHCLGGLSPELKEKAFME
ncbi:forkhead-associated (FHA) domain-containing protein [Actinidia rufa]|uniref:Forkhead-associated (FHA) domain-containing protein n=1 Tax=Actinidia rufa TaxID=165716 RepID=A0A7J0EJI4_9ERIC|nr:forkhead-associated (FHA) domain-containing protein [Actinidia rufa]